MALDVVTYALLRKYTDTEISRIIEGMSEGMSFKGSVANYESLPSDPVGGDLYILQDPSCKAVWDSSKSEWILFDKVLTKVSELENDAGYLTEHQDISHLATKESLETGLNEVDNQIESIHSEMEKFVNSDELASELLIIDSKFNETENELNSIQEELVVINKNIDSTEESIEQVKESIEQVQESIPSLEGYATEQFVNDAVAAQDSKTEEQITSIKTWVEDQEYIGIDELESKQDKLIAGDNITIIGNVISAIGGGDSTLGRTFVTDITVGHLEAGTSLNSTDTVQDILYRILYGSGATDTVVIYYGALDNVPTSYEGLNSEVVEKSAMSKLGVHIDAGNEETEDGQYVTIAIPNTYSITEWVAKGAETFPLNYSSVIYNNYNVYYLDNPSYDKDLGGIDYFVITIEGGQ